MMITAQLQSAALARFFSAAVVKELASRGSSPTLARLVRESGVDVDVHSLEAIGTLFDRAFHLLKQPAHRNEYIYKAALTQKVLLGIHSLSTASMMTEFRIGQCKADVVILNGTGTVYEIKSERDNLSRLHRQVESYARVFAKVNVIVGENHLSSVCKSVPKFVGILVLSDRHQVSTIREAKEDARRTSSTDIFEAISQREATMVLEDAGFEVPDVPNTQRYRVLRELFATLDADFAHRAMVRTLKRTRNLLPLTSLLQEIPESLHTASISARLRVKERSRLVTALRTPICKAVCWG